MKSLILILTLIFSTSSFAELLAKKPLTFVQKDRKDFNQDFKDQDEKSFTISKIQIREIPAIPVFGRGQLPGVIPVPGYAGGVITIVDRLMAVGMKVWKIVDEGRPVFTNGLRDNFSVLPFVENGTLNFEDMTSWERPVYKAYKVEYANGNGNVVISFTYNISYFFGGKYLEKGSYLSGLSVRASNVTVSWGFALEAQSELLSIVNHGTSEDPIAGAMIEIDYRVKSIFKDVHAATAFHVTGDGKLEYLY